jgi:hypothetical protein
MNKFTLRHIVLLTVILLIVLGLSGCQVGEGIDRAADAFSRLPDRIVIAISNVLGGISEVGAALGDMVRNMVRGMTGR